MTFFDLTCMFVTTVLIFIFCLVFYLKSLNLTNAWDKHITEWKFQKYPVSREDYFGSLGAGWLGWMGMVLFGGGTIFSFILIVIEILYYFFPWY